MATDGDKIKKILTTADLSTEEIRELIKKVDPSYAPLRYKKYALSQTRRRFGIVGDTHMNSDQCNLEFLHAAYDFFKKQGADFVVQTGDLTEGEEMRKDQKFFLHVQGIDKVVQHVAENYPSVGLDTYFIGGNHDEAYLKHAGHDICANIASKRKDLIYLGMNEGDLPKDIINCKVKIWHSGKGCAKGLSYQQQELLNSIVDQEEDKPNILIVGHFHKTDYLFFQNVHVYQAGTLQDQTGFMRFKHLAADLRCWLLDVYTQPSGQVDRIHHKELSWRKLNGK